MSYQYFFGGMAALSSDACVFDTTPPTFGGITSVTPNTDGSISAAWSLATGTPNPIEHLVYIALGVVNAATLFQSTNLVAIAPAGATSRRIYTLADSTTFLVKGLQYTIGIRARDGVGNMTSNTQLLTATAISSGNLPTVLQDLADDLEATSDALSATASSIAGGAGTQMSFETTETVMSIETDGVA